MYCQSDSKIHASLALKFIYSLVRFFFALAIVIIISSIASILKNITVLSIHTCICMRNCGTGSRAELILSYNQFKMKFPNMHKLSKVNTVWCSYNKIKKLVDWHLGCNAINSLLFHQQNYFIVTYTVQVITSRGKQFMHKNRLKSPFCLVIQLTTHEEFNVTAIIRMLSMQTLHLHPTKQGLVEA